MTTSYTSSPLQTHKASFSPLDQIALNASRHGAPVSKQSIMQRATELSRVTAEQAPGSDTSRTQQLEHGYGGGTRTMQTQQYTTLQNPSNPRFTRSAHSSPLASSVTSFDQEQSLEGPSQTLDSRLGLGNAFRDSVASDASFNSLSGPHERASMLGFADVDGDEATSLDRIADEVRGLELRRRQSVDTVRSSEFGEGGRWANAWASSDDDRSTLRGSDDEDDDDEGDASVNFQSHQMSALDIEGANGPRLGDFDRPRGQAGSASRGASSLQVHPPLHKAASAERVVTLTPSMQSSRQASSSSLRPSMVHDGRRDTITSMAGDIIGGSSDQSGIPSDAPMEFQRQHERSSSTDTVSAASVYSDANSNVVVWPPTPANNVAAMQGRPTLNFARPIRQMRAEDSGQGSERSALTQTTQAPFQQRRPSKPMSPSAALAEPLDRPILTRLPSDTVRSSAGSPHQGSSRYNDPNLPMYPAGLDSLGERRRKAVADHDGRESLVSDLDVETLRLDGSSNSSGSSHDWDSRRASTSTVGTVSSLTLEEQRRRRSHLEQIHEIEADRRQSVATIRGADNASGPVSELVETNADYIAADGSLRRRVSVASPESERANPFDSRPPQPKRSNTQPGRALHTIQSPSSGHTPSPRLEGRDTAHSGVQTNPSREGASTPQSSRSPSLAPSVLSPTSRSFANSSTNLSLTSSPASVRRSAAKANTPTSQAEKFLTLGIQHHESGDLSRSAYYFERSAKIEGGCVVGMCMWGMALREGWGVRKDQKRGFEWISRAAARAGELMNSASGQKPRTEFELKAIRSELKLSVYELGKCFCYGWGVKMDKQMALEYFELAAKLGDADAQAEAGALLAAGKGCKKDLKKAAMYYRMAEAQGYDTVGLSWIHKDKYDPA